MLRLFSGRGIVTELVKYPEIEVVGLSRSKVELENSNFTFLKCDVANAGDVTNAFNQIENKFPNKKISILINNAGMSKVNPLNEPELSGHFLDASAKPCLSDFYFKTFLSHFPY